MKYLAFVVLLTTVQAAPPIPRKASNHQGTGANNISEQATDTQRVPASSLIKNSAKPTETQNRRCDETNDNQPVTVIVPKLPMVSVGKDRLDIVSVVFSCGLFFVGSAGTFLALSTLSAIKRQTAALIASQSPYLAATPHGNAAQTILEKAPRVQVAICNKGTTPAYDVLYETWIEVMQTPFSDFSSNAVYFRQNNKFVLYPHHEPTVVHIPLLSGLTEEVRTSLKNRELIACLRIRVTYRDAFTPERYVNFGYQIAASGLEFLPKYNDGN